MKYFVLFGDYQHELEMEQYDTELEVLSRIIELKENNDYDELHVIKGEKLEIVASYTLKED